MEKAEISPDVESLKIYFRSSLNEMQCKMTNNHLKELGFPCSGQTEVWLNALFFGIDRAQDQIEELFADDKMS